MSPNYQISDVKMTNELFEQFGREIVLFDEQEESIVYMLLSEFTVGGHAYAVLQSEPLRKEDEVAVFKVVKDEQGNIELETIEDDDEWENVSEIYDEMTFPADE
jgi:uncharacterized protein YrzB (UPF0473 family)